MQQVLQFLIDHPAALLALWAVVQTLRALLFVVAWRSLLAILRRRRAD